MRAVMVMFDTLSRRYLPSYGAEQIIAPNFERLEKNCCVFENFYGGSMPCMPARRELHTGRYNFLHRGWGPLEPFDFSVFERLRERGVYTHLVTDHSHYFEDGGATYHNRYDTWEGFRGQEGDRWQPKRLARIDNRNPLNKKGDAVIQHYANRTKIKAESDMPSIRTMQAGMEFLEHHKDKDNWFLQIECFDPHEPFYVPEKYRKMYGCVDRNDAFFWPPYQMVSPSVGDRDLEDVRKEYAALITMCDAHLGKILDFMDENHMWEDTMLIVNTDHGFFLGEKGYLGKNYMPMYDEIVHLPFYIHVPGMKEAGRRKALSQTIDIAPTLLDYFGAADGTEDMDGQSLRKVIEKDQPLHEYALYGIHGGHVNIFDGRYVYMKSADSEIPLPSITLMPTRMRGFFSGETLSSPQLVPGSRFTNQIPALKYYEPTFINSQKYGDLLFDMEKDPLQEHNLTDETLVDEMCEKLKAAMQKLDAPEEVFERTGFK